MKEELLSALYCEFINRVNEVGVDVNRAISHPYTQSLVQFICGLGIRKGSHLLKVSVLVLLLLLMIQTSLERASVCVYGELKGSNEGSYERHSPLQILKQNNTRLENRTQLVTICHMGPKVFINCAGFIKIDTASLGDRCLTSSSEASPLERGCE